MNYYLCADQGCSKTAVAVCAEDGTVVGTAAGEGSPLYYNDPDNRSTATVRRLAGEILSTAGMEWECLTAACSGVICLDWPFETAIHENRLRDALEIEKVTALNDSLIALRAGSAAPNRCVICAGTGLNIAAKTAEGATFVYGNYIPMRIMGGLALGGAAIEMAAEAEAKIRPPTTLTDMLLDYTGYPSFESFFTDFTTGKYEFAQQCLVPGLLKTAAAGDAASVEILDNFISEVSRYTEALLKRMDLTDRDAELVYSGGIFKNTGQYISEAITCRLTPLFPRLRYINARLEPVCGAMLYMLDKKYGGGIPKSVSDTFMSGCLRLGLLRD